MRRRTEAGLLALWLSSGGLSCVGSKHYVMVPTGTAEGAACVRQCNAVWHQCVEARAHRCRWDEHQCLKTCPGAVDVTGVPDCKAAKRQAGLSGPVRCQPQDEI